MDLILFAQVGNPKGNDQAFQMGIIIGTILAVIVCLSIPIAVGAKRGHPILGVIGGICSIPTALLFGCLGGLPVAALFVIIILALGDPNASRKKKKSRRREEDEDDEDEEDEDDRPRKRRRRRDDGEDD